MPTYFPFSHVIGNLSERINRRIVRHSYSAPWTVTAQEVKPQPVVAATRQISELYY